jgi:hypothetical protein
MRAEGSALSLQGEDSSRRLAAPFARDQSPEGRDGVGSGDASPVWHRRTRSNPSRTDQRGDQHGYKIADMTFR